MKQLRQEPVNLRQTDNVEWQWIDSATGDLSAQGCDGAMYIPLLRQTVPRRATLCGQSHYEVEPTNIPSEEDTQGDHYSDGTTNTNYIRESENQMDTDLSNHNSTRVISSGSYSGEN
jgi:penicillin-binding protein 1B